MQGAAAKQLKAAASAQSQHAGEVAEAAGETSGHIPFHRCLYSPPMIAMISLSPPLAFPFPPSLLQSPKLRPQRGVENAIAARAPPVLPQHTVGSIDLSRALPRTSHELPVPASHVWPHELGAAALAYSGLWTTAGASNSRE
jgi:hypothetical protein